MYLNIVDCFTQLNRMCIYLRFLTSPRQSYVLSHPTERHKTVLQIYTVRVIYEEQTSLKKGMCHVVESYFYPSL